jgi:hypothetical protein
LTLLLPAHLAALHRVTRDPKLALRIEFEIERVGGFDPLQHCAVLRSFSANANVSAADWIISFHWRQRDDRFSVSKSPIKIMQTIQIRLATNASVLDLGDSRQPLGRNSRRPTLSAGTRR